MKIKKDIKIRLERFINQHPRNDEYGGFLLKNRNDTVSEFLIIPNTSDSKKDTYRMPEGSIELAKKYAGSKRLEVIAHWHNHPTPCVLSAQDCRSGESWEPLFSVMISPTANTWNPEFMWYAHKGIKPEKIEFAGKAS